MYECVRGRVCQSLKSSDYSDVCATLLWETVSMPIVIIARERASVNVCESYITVCIKSLLMKHAFRDFIE